MSTRLAQDFYALDTIDVARRLLGKRLVHRPGDGRRLSGLIVETEAYLGAEDPASHAFNQRRTPRTEVIFGPPGHSYVYFIYGMYFCFNVVTMARGVAEAVLVRALEPVNGVDANGPGKLCRVLGIDRAHNSLDLCANPFLWIEDDRDTLEHEIVEGPRIGLGDKHDAVHWPLRFGINGHPALTKAFPPSN